MNGRRRSRRESKRQCTIKTYRCNFHFGAWNKTEGISCACRGKLFTYGNTSGRQLYFRHCLGLACYRKEKITYILRSDLYMRL